MLWGNGSIQLSPKVYLTSDSHTVPGSRSTSTPWAVVVYVSEQQYRGAESTLAFSMAKTSPFDLAEREINPGCPSRCSLAPIRVIGEIGREATAHCAAAESQNLRAHLDAIYFLQDELHLPHRQATPIYSGMSFMTDRIARRIGDKVRNAATEKDGERVIEFMSTWTPWVLHLQNHEEHRADFEKITQNYHSNLEHMVEDREDPNSPVHSSVMDQVTFDAEIASICNSRNRWMSDYVGQLTRTFLINHRADYLAEHGVLPAYFDYIPQKTCHPGLKIWN